MAKLETFKQKSLRETSLEEFSQRLLLIKKLTVHKLEPSKDKKSATYKSNKEKQVEDLFKKLSPEEYERLKELIKNH